MASVMLLCNLGKKIVDKFGKLSKIGFSVEYLTADFSQFSMKICLLDCGLGNYYQLQAFHGFS